MSVSVRAISIVSAVLACDRWHSHHEPPMGGLFALGAFDGQRLCCVAVVGPNARMLDTGGCVEVTRLASDGSVRGAASAVLRAAVLRAAVLGHVRVVSYTLLGEVGACYRAARWRPTAVTRGGSWSRAGRFRLAPLQSGRKVRWESGVGALPRSKLAESAILASLGVAITRRIPTQTELAL